VAREGGTEMEHSDRPEKPLGARGAYVADHVGEVP
jgi:hypothetical protein